MRTLLQFRRYLRPQLRTIILGLIAMGFYALLNGFSISLILPIVDKVFVGAEQSPAGTLAVGDGLTLTWNGVREAWGSASGVTSRADAAKTALTAGLTRIQQESAPLDVLAWVCVITLVVILLKNLFDYIRRIAFIKVEQRSAEAIRNDVFDHVLNFPLSVHRSFPGGQLLSRLITDVELLKQYTISTAVHFANHASQLVVLFILCLWASPQLSLVSFVVVPPVILVTGRLASRLRRYSARAQQRIADLTATVTEALASIRVVKGFGMEDKEGLRFARHSRGYTKAVVRMLSLDTLAAPLSEFWGVTIGVAVLYYGGRLVLSPESDMTPGRFFVFLLALVSMLRPLKALANTFTTFQRGAAAGDRVLEIMNIATETDIDGTRVLKNLTRGVRFESVSFAYEPGRPVLRDITLEARVGTTTALVGPSGGGKSTLVDLIPRFHDPDTGRVFLDDIDLREFRLRDLRRRIGIVTQETILFDESVLENIAYGMDHATRDEVEQAARMANAHDFILEMPQGYETQIGERGARLSGGQRQRLAIARALLRNPPILILDEATSSLDTESESAVQEALERLLSDRTTFVIAHRLSTVMNADLIAVVDRGRVVDTGTHEKLLRTSTLYRRLHDLQFRKAAP